MFKRFARNSRYNPGLFATLQYKCQEETRFGRLANLLIFSVLTLISNLRKISISIREQGLSHAVWGYVNSSKILEIHQPAGLPDNIRDFFHSRLVLIVAELSIPQCRRYRVDQKVEALKALGYEVEVRPFHKLEECMQLIPFSALVLFYRTPHWPDVKTILQECQRLSIPTIYDIDDLVFDVEEYSRHPVLNSMKESERNAFLDGARSYGECLAACQHAIASTKTLAEAMKKLNRGKVLVLENALDSISLRAVELAGKRPRARDSRVVIGYGSGTRSHDKDFALAAPALLRIMREHPDVHLRIQGYLNTGSEFAEFSDRIETISFLPTEAYLLSLAELDINLAPLENSVFNDAKSSIKYLESAIFGVPTVASPTQTFSEDIEHGVNGFLADCDEGWYHALNLLVSSPALRQQIGLKAKNCSFKKFDSSVTRDRLGAFLTDLRLAVTASREEKNRPRILSVNIFYAPQRYGGATVVLEQILQRTKDQFKHAVFSLQPREDVAPYFCTKSDQDGVLTYGISFDPEQLGRYDLFHPALEEPFKRTLAEFQPDIVHFHALQTLGVPLLALARVAGSRVIVTSHDAWWVCARQFMAQKDGKFCGQSRVDLNKCGQCTGKPAETWERSLELLAALDNVDLVLAPSVYQQNFLRLNLPSNIPIIVHKNGIDLGGKPSGNPRTHKKVRFGYIGGIGATHKGYYLIKNAFEALSRNDWEMVIVDLEQQLHSTERTRVNWRVSGKVNVTKPFRPDGIDAFYEDIDVLLAPSLIPESFGLAAREAWVRGCQVICTRQGGVAEDLEGRPGVFMFDVRQPDEFSSILSLVFESHPRSRQDAQSRTLHSYDDQASQLCQIYENILQSKVSHGTSHISPIEFSHQHRP